jgi:hypothetical protein
MFELFCILISAFSCFIGYCCANNLIHSTWTRRIENQQKFVPKLETIYEEDIVKMELNNLP